MKILIIDCFDSFTYNLYHMLENVNDSAPEVLRVDACSISDVDEADGIVFSPGPGLPAEFMNLSALVNHACRRKPVLGICLGHQAIAEQFGGRLYRQEKPFHGVARKAFIKKQVPLFESISETFDAGSYHSWSVDFNSVSEEFEATAVDESRGLLAMQHKNLPIWSMQFHPESVLTPSGEIMLRNWVRYFKS
ncbi:MAG: aminodeoxychorismate/anthranilate synthase component II [Bacteroidetes bacterium]|nr:aminodeoxychorismate/anthranilate synthase component II [Bacteroidota bacterium]